MKRVVITILLVLGSLVLMAQEEYIPHLQVETITVFDTVNMDGGNINNMADGISPMSAVNRRQLDSTEVQSVELYLDNDSIWMGLTTKTTTVITSKQPVDPVFKVSVAAAITSEDTTRWGQVSGIEYDPVYANDSIKIVWFDDLSGIRDTIRQHADSLLSVYDTLHIVQDSINRLSDSVQTWTNSVARHIIESDTLRWGSITASDTLSKVIVTKTELINYINETGIMKTIYSITLPASSTVAGRVALAVEGVDYPDGWVLQGDGYDLIVNHNMGRWGVDVKVFSNITGTVRQQLRNTAAENGFSSLDSNTVKISSLATIYTKIIIYIIFES